MKLRAQSLWFGIASMAGLFLLVAAVGTLILLPAADQEDRRDMSSRLTRMESRLAQRIDQVRVYANEYGPWTDTVEFIAGEKPEYVEDNLDADQLGGARICVVVIWDDRGRRVVARLHDRDSKEVGEAPGDLVDDLEGRPELPRRVVGETREGVIATPRGLLLFSAQPVTGNDREPPSRGTFFAGQFLDEAELAELTAGEDHLAELRVGAAAVGEAGDRSMSIRDADTMSGVLVLRDPAGRAAGSIVLTTGRHARHAQTRGLWLVGAALFVGAGMFAALTWWLLKRRFLRRIEALTREVGRLESDAAVRARLASTPGDDELAQLARDTGGMAEKLAQAREAAEAGTRAKGAFLAAMSHEIRTPLNGVLGYIGLLKETALTPEQREHARVIEDSGNVLLGVINEILDFSKLESGRVDLESIPTDVRAVAGEVLALFTPRVKMKDVRLTLEVAPDVPDRVAADPLRLRQVLTNLVGNAVKFTAAGAVTVRVQTWRGEAEGLYLEVRDTGIGLTAVQLERIFQPFAQADSSTTRRYGGTGLGLAISQRLVRAWGGVLSVKSEPGCGAIFGFTLPARAERTPIMLGESAGVPVVSGEPARTDRAPLRILMAEDNAVNARLLAALLNRHGYSAEHVTDGAAALAAMRAREFDLVLMDVQMPEMDGLEATRRRRAWEKESGCARVLIAALTANALAGAREECMAAGMDEYLAKPYQPKQLSSLLERAEARRVAAR